jgi:quinol monooxygenase YgiN
MYARSTTINGKPECLDAGIGLCNELLPQITSTHGCLGMSVLVDRSTGRCIATSSWESEEAMRASSDQLQPMRERLLETLQGDGITIAEWEIAIMHRDHDAGDQACARITWAKPPEGMLDTAVEAFKANVLPLLEQEDGFTSASMLVDRQNGMLCGTACFDATAALEANREFGAQQRAAMAERTGIEFVDVIECELAVHHLRVPELV